MRLLTLIVVVLAGSLAASEPEYPLWDGHESVADYAKRVNMPATKTLDLGNDVTMDLVLIPAGKFIMGTPEPAPVNEDGFRKKIVIGQALLAACAGALLVMLAAVAIRAVRKRRRPQLSLGRLVLVTAATGGCVLSGLHWRQSARGLEKARMDFIAATARYDVAENDEKPAHAVTLTKPDYMGKFAVTQEQYQAVIGSNPSTFNGKDNPVERVSWDDVQKFCKKLREQTKQNVRLPTEAEWEYSCRAGTTTMYYSGDSETDLARVAWYYANSKNTTHPVGKKEPNAFGLFDMHGNVWQWCQDPLSDSYYTRSPAENPKGPTNDPDPNAFRMLRGGSWLSGPVDCRSARRFRDDPGNYTNDMGFRVAVAPSYRTP